MAKNIVVKPGEKRTRAYFLENMKKGNCVAFTMGERMLSGRIVKIESDKVTVRTKNGSIFFPKKEEITWVLTGSNWPVGIRNALRFGKDGGM